MPRFKFYITKLDKEHKFVSSNTKQYLSTLDAVYTTPDINVVYDADTLKIEIPFTTGRHQLPNYAVAVNEHDVPLSFYHVDAKSKITNAVVECDLTLDLWAMATQELVTPPKITGTLVSAHDFPDIVWNDRFYSNFTFPVKPERGRLVAASPAYDYETKTNIVAIMSVTIIVSGEEWTVLVSSPTIGYNDRVVLRAYIQNMSRARGITYNNTTHEVKSINKMWIVPAFCAAEGITGNGNASLDLDDEGLQNISVWWLRQTFNYTLFFENRDFTLRHYIISGDRFVPAISAFGNFGTNVDYPLNGVVRRPVKIDWSVDWNTGYIAAYMRVYGETIDLMPSLTVNISAQVTNERALSRQLNDALGILSGVVALGGSIAVKSPVGIAGAATALTGTVANIASRVNYTATSIEGNAMLNLYSTNDATGAIESLPSFGYLKYEVANIGEVMAELRRVGFVGEYFVQDLSLTSRTTAHYPFTYSGTYRRFIDPIVETKYTRARDEIKRMCEVGFTVYYPATSTPFGGELFVPLDFTNADE